jgi:hypothetical protein
MYAMLVGYPPFNGSTPENIIKKIMENNLDFTSSNWKNISKVIFCL